MSSRSSSLSGPLAAQLTDFRAAFSTRATPERIATMEAATAQLRASGIEQSALKAGRAAPDLTLPDAVGRPVRLSQLWASGPAVLVFYRGGWCPYCNLELRAWQQRLPQLESLGVSIVAVSPQTPDSSLSTAEKNALAFQVLSDSSLHAARAFGILYDLPPQLVTLYQGVGHDLPSTNGNDSWSLPVPATYVVDTQGCIVFAHVDADYRNRSEPDDVIAAISTVVAHADGESCYTATV